MFWQYITFQNDKGTSDNVNSLHCNFHFDFWHWNEVSFECFIFPYENTAQWEQSILITWIFFFCRKWNNRGCTNCFARLRFRIIRSQFSLSRLEYNLDLILGVNDNVIDSGNPTLPVKMFFRRAGAIFRFSLWHQSLTLQPTLSLCSWFQDHCHTHKTRFGTPKSEEVPNLYHFCFTELTWQWQNRALQGSLHPGCYWSWPQSTWPELLNSLSVSYTPVLRPQQLPRPQC